MKLKNGIVTNSIDGESFAIATGEASKSFNGLIKNNPTAAYIFELLKTEQTEESIVKWAAAWPAPISWDGTCS